MPARWQTPPTPTPHSPGRRQAAEPSAARASAAGLTAMAATKEDKERVAAALQEEARPVFLAIGLDEKVVE